MEEGKGRVCGGSTDRLTHRFFDEKELKGVE